MRASRVLVRSSIVLVASVAALGACGDDDDVAPQTTLLDGGTSSSSSSGSIDSGPKTDSAVVHPETGSPMDAATADAADAADATDAADSGDSGDAGPAEPVGPAPLLIAYAGRNFGIDTRPVSAFTFAGTKLDAWTAAAPYTEVFDHGTTSITDVSVLDGVLATGHWQDGTATEGANTWPWPAKGGALYIIGQTPTTLPSTGIVSLVQAVATPAIVSDGSTDPGTISGSAGLAYQVNGTVKVGFNATVIIGTDTYLLASVGGAAAPNNSDITSDDTGRFGSTYNVASASGLCSGSCTVSVQGFVSGPNGEHLALVVHAFTTAGGAPTTVSGGLLFKKP